MKEFFQTLIDQLPIKIGVDMYAIYEIDQLNAMVEELVKAGEQIPFNKISDDVKKRILEFIAVGKLKNSV